MNAEWDRAAEEYRLSRGGERARRWANMTPEQQEYLMGRYGMTPPRPMDLNRFERSVNIYLIGLAVVIAGALAVAIFNDRAERAERKQEAESQIPGPFQVGDIVFLRWDDPNKISILRETDRPNDDATAAQMLFVDWGTKAEIVDGTATQSKVKLLEGGRNLGKVGWIDVDFVHKE